MTPRPPQGNTPVALLARKRTGWKWLTLWGVLLVGHIVGYLASPPWKTSFHGPVVANLLLLPCTAVIAAAFGPLIFVAFGLFAFCVQRGTNTAVGIFVLGAPLLYTALILGLRRWWKTESPHARFLGGLVLASYNALVTFCVLFFGFRV